MTDPTFALKDGVLVETEPHSLPVTRHFKGCEKPVTLVEHAHDETVYMGLNKDTHFKGAKNINFKYGGVGIEFSTPLYRAGLLKGEEETSASPERAASATFASAFSAVSGASAPSPS